MKIEELQELLEPSKPEKPAKEESSDFGIVLGNHPDNHDEHIAAHVPIYAQPIPLTFSTSSIMTFTTSNGIPVNWDGYSTKLRIKEAINNRGDPFYYELQRVLNNELRAGNIYAWTMQRDYHDPNKVMLRVHYTSYSSICYYL